MEVRREDLSGTYNKNGYMLTYKGKPIGGAGVLHPGSNPINRKLTKADMKYYEESIQREIDHIVNGTGQNRFYEIIAKINKEQA